MQPITIEGSPQTINQFEKALKEELDALGYTARVQLETKTAHLEVPPGEMGFGDEIKKILLGIADLLQAVPKATEHLARGIAKRIAQGKFSAQIGPDGTILLRAGGQIDVEQTTKAIAQIIQAQKP